MVIPQVKHQARIVMMLPIPRPFSSEYAAAMMTALLAPVITVRVRATTTLRYVTYVTLGIRLTLPVHVLRVTQTQNKPLIVTIAQQVSVSSLVGKGVRLVKQVRMHVPLTTRTCVQENVIRIVRHAMPH